MDSRDFVELGQPAVAMLRSEVIRLIDDKLPTLDSFDCLLSSDDKSPKEMMQRSWASLEIESAKCFAQLTMSATTCLYDCLLAAGWPNKASLKLPLAAMTMEMAGMM